MVFLKYAVSCKNGQQWVTATEYAKRIARQKQTASVWRANNREKARAFYRNWLKNNREKAREACKKWAEKNKDKRRQDFRLWAAKNRDKIRRTYLKHNQKYLLKYKQKRKDDPVYSLICTVRCRINHCSRTKKIGRQSVNESILGCSWADFVKTLESQFLPGMTWENRSSWHLDHIVPLSIAKSTEEVLDLNHYSNLKPMWSRDNLSKGKTVPKTLPEGISDKVKAIWSRHSKD